MSEPRSSPTETPATKKPPWWVVSVPRDLAVFLTVGFGVMCAGYIALMVFGHFDGMRLMMTIAYAGLSLCFLPTAVYLSKRSRNRRSAP